MDWKLILRDLNANGIKDARIAAYAGVSQAQINKLKSGEQDDLYYKKGLKITELGNLVGIVASQLKK